MAKSIFILEDIAACSQFSDGIHVDDIPEKKILGIGSFFTHTNQKTAKGLFIHVTPTFLTNEIRQGIVNGYISAFEQNTLFFQVSSPNPLIPISSWLLYGHHLSPFLDHQTNAKSPVFDDILKKLASPEEFVQFFLNKIFQKLNEIKANIVVYLFDPKPLSQFINLSLQPTDRTQNFEISNLENRIIHAVFSFLTQTQHTTTFAIVPSHKEHYEIFLKTASQIQKNTDTQVSFKL